VVNLPRFAILSHQQSRGIELPRNSAWNHLWIASQETHCGWRTEKYASRVSIGGFLHPAPDGDYR
jgi:hypothetical protein